MKFLWLLFLLAAGAQAAQLQLITGGTLEGECEWDAVGITVRPANGPVVKLGFLQIQRARFATEAPEALSPGLLLKSGVRIAGQPRWKIAPEDVAWVIWQPLTAAQTSQVPAGRTGALLPGGDFFEGTVKSADAESARVNNPIFGPRTFTAKNHDALAVVLREIRRAPALFEFLLNDGSLYLCDQFVATNKDVTLRHALYNGLRLDLKDIAEFRRATPLPPKR